VIVVTPQLLLTPENVLRTAGQDILVLIGHSRISQFPWVKTAGFLSIARYSESSLHRNRLPSFYRDLPHSNEKRGPCVVDSFSATFISILPIAISSCPPPLLLPPPLRLAAENVLPRQWDWIPLRKDGCQRSESLISTQHVIQATNQSQQASQTQISTTQNLLKTLS
jgi:hypothetical protein